MSKTGAAKDVDGRYHAEADVDLFQHKVHANVERVSTNHRFDGGQLQDSEIRSRAADVASLKDSP
jgi:hypothetical protein